MLPQRVIFAFRCSTRCWRHRTPRAAFVQAPEPGGHGWRCFSAPVSGGGGPSVMEEILTRVVAPLPIYETRDKAPPPLESNSLEFMHFYKSLDKEDRLSFLTKLSQDFGVDHQSVSDLAVKLMDTQFRDMATILQVEDRLRYSLTPRYRQFLSHISRVEGGVKFLVDLRTDLLEIISSKASESPQIRVNIFVFICRGSSVSKSTIRFQFHATRTENQNIKEKSRQLDLGSIAKEQFATANPNITGPLKLLRDAEPDPLPSSQHTEFPREYL